MKHYLRSAIFLTCGLSLCAVMVAAANADNLFTNGDFAQAPGDNAPAGWDHRTAGQGYIKTHARDGEAPAFVEIGVNQPGEDSFIQQIAKIPDDAKRLRLAVTYRWADIVGGDKGYQKGKVQGRFTKAGKDFGNWIDMGNLSGSSDGWVTKTREVGINPEADGLMLRLGFYGVKSGRLDVAEARLETITEEDIAAQRAKYRPAAPYGPEVSDERFARIQNGVNINGWFCQAWNQKIDGKKGGFNAEFFRAYITEQDIAMIRQMGFDHVRLPIDPLFLNDIPAGGKLKTDLLGEVDRAIKMIRDHGLAVIVDVHPKSNDYKKMSGKPEVREAFVNWWGQFAAHLAKTTDPEWVFLELLNEPGGQGYWANAQWEAYQDRLITIVRANAPDHTIIANGGAYMLVKELGKVEPHPDRNMIWAVHYYEPSPFTHQGAAWMKDWYQPLNEVPWPLTQENLDDTIAKLKDHKAKDQSVKVLRDQVNNGYATREHMVEQIGRVVAWAKQHNRRVHIGEYGVMDNAPRDSRLRYHRAISEVFDELGVARALWNYSGSNYSVVLGPDNPGDRSPDWELAEALGLRRADAAAAKAE